MENIILLSNDNEEFMVKMNIAEKSVLIKNMLEDIDNSDAPIPLPNVSSKILNKINYASLLKMNVFKLINQQLVNFIYHNTKNTNNI